ncbi:MAG: hypothetical protein J7647_03975 [Cyanobacteria bacterium SBLK]|nr:hypothetical protein [Cyanobacteria bacterium SBLK]
MQDSLFFHFEYELERRLEDLIGVCLEISLPSLHLTSTGEICLNFTERDDLNRAIDAFRAHTSFLQDMEIDRIEFQYRGEFYIKYSVPALSEASERERVEESTKASLKKLATGRRGGKRLLDSNLWNRLA